MNCFKCSEPLKTGAKFCNECGAKQQISCPTCGEALQPGETVCADCCAKHQIATYMPQEVTPVQEVQQGQPAAYEVPAEMEQPQRYGTEPRYEELPITNSVAEPQATEQVGSMSLLFEGEGQEQGTEEHGTHFLEMGDGFDISAYTLSPETQQYHQEILSRVENFQKNLTSTEHLPPTSHLSMDNLVQYQEGSPTQNMVQPIMPSTPPVSHTLQVPPPPQAHHSFPPVYPTTATPPRGMVKDACTEGDAKNRGFTFERVEMGYRITAFNGRNSSPNIPGFIEGAPVFEISREAFEGKGVESVTIPEGIVEVGDWSFTDNAITKLDLPDSVQYIGLCAFKNNRINTVTIPRTLKKVDKEAFECNKLTQINLPQMLDYIGQSAFSYNNLTNVVIPGSVTYIGNHAFSYNQISSLIISPGVSFLGEDAFAYNQLSSVSVPYGVTEISDAAFYMNKLTKIIIPSSVHTIGENAFRSNQLTNVGIPGSVMNIHPNAFDKWVEIIKI